MFFELFVVGVDSESQPVDCVHDVVGAEEVQRHVFVVFDQVHQFLHRGVVAKNGVFCDCEGCVESGNS